MSWEENVKSCVPYTPGDQPDRPGMIKINTNECPYPPSPGVTAALRELSGEQLRLYPDPSAGLLKESLAEYYGVDRDQVFVGVGSDDVLALCFLTFFNGKKPVLFPDVTYSFYDVWAKLFGIPYQRVSLDEAFCIRPEDYAVQNGGVIFPNPNAPTGVLESIELIEEVLKANPDSAVIVDEAYIDFGGRSSLCLLPKYENLLVVQTFSKSRAMAGMRIGFAIGNRKMISHLENVKFSFNSYTMNRPAIVCGAAALRDDAYFKSTVQKIVATRERVKKELSLLGFSFPDSKANFIFAAHRERPAEEIFEALKKNDIYVRYFKKPRTDNYLRISIGTDEEMDGLLSFLKSYL